MADMIHILLRALELDNNGDWDAAHTTVQPQEDQRAYWIHAYLHRKEGDLSNARYWYNRAGRSMPNHTLEEEWNTIYDALGSV